MRAHDRAADAQADAHVAAAVGRLHGAERQIAVKEHAEQLRRDTVAVVGHGQPDAAALGTDLDEDLRCRRAVLGDILQQVEQHLLDERGVHRREQDLFRL